MSLVPHRRGLVYCPDRNVYHFDDSDPSSERIKFNHVDGKGSHVSMVGDRTWGSGERASKYRYQLGPKFKVSIDADRNWWVTTRIYVRVTEADGTLFKEKQIGKRRKKVTKSWWNKQWFIRTLAMMQALREDPQSDTIDIGAGRRKVAISTAPLHWACPVAIDVEAVDKIGDLQEELASIGYVEDDEVDDEEEAK